jgi:hypothetical protein
MAAREMTPEALAVIRKCLRSKDERVALMAAGIALDRGWGKPEVTAEVTMAHKFAVVPQVMEQGEWLRNRGQPTPVLDLKSTCPDAATTLDSKLSVEPPEKLN